MLKQTTTEKPHVVIIGGGFGGLAAARALEHAPAKITLIDRHNYHLFQPLLYQVAMAGLSSTEIATPIRSILSKQQNIEVLLDEVTQIDLDNQTIKRTQGETKYDYLILAAGAQTSYFGHPEWAQVTLGLKDLDDAIEIRRRVLLAFEAAEKEPDADKRKALLTFVIIGGGPTGVELAGLLVDLAKHALSRDFRHISPESAKVILLEGKDRILLAFPEDCSASAASQLQKLGVEVRTKTMVKDIQEDGVCIQVAVNNSKTGEMQLVDEFIPSPTIIWCAGVAATPITKTLQVKLDPAGRVFVEPDLSIPGHPEAFAIGDLSLFLHQDVNQTEKPKPLPGVAPVAMQQGKAVAKYISDTISGAGKAVERKTFHYEDKGNLAIIGRAAAVADINGLHLKGLIAWLSWLFIHIFFLIGFRNKVVVMLDWCWSYLTYQRGARLITGNRLVPGPVKKTGEDTKDKTSHKVVSSGNDPK
ncbi:MAG: NAD(P)/FAD-dependent oxidoreductase [Candidatus Obscuribacterales bacterium]|jgi:NADH dehydrogenase|nr:NAD(P)/FAD-dependent oxidoreductase [Candidatus Obscuribacterales bacterium]